MDDAIHDALRWLASHQDPDGSWEPRGWPAWCDGKPAPEGNRPTEVCKEYYEVGVTSLALLAFLGEGYTNRSDGPYGKVVYNGLKFLRNLQDPEGCFGARSSGKFVYTHAIATLAMVEAFGMTGSALYRFPAQLGLDFIEVARNPYFGWGYGVAPGVNDTSITGWMMLALDAARRVNAADVEGKRAPSLKLNGDSFLGVKAWIDKATDRDSGRVGYRLPGSRPDRSGDTENKFPAEKSESTTAIGVLARVLLGETLGESLPVKKGANLCAHLPPTWRASDGSIDMYYWFFGSQAMFRIGGPRWNAWYGALAAAGVDTQRTDGEVCAYKGSWDPVDPWGGHAGRVYATALMVLTLETPYRCGTANEPAPTAQK